MIIKRIVLLLSIFCFTAPGARSAVILNLDSASNALSGQAGSTVGWGFTLSSSQDFAVITSSNFCLGTSGVNSACVGSLAGVYSDYIATNLTVAGLTPITQAFNIPASQGIGQFSISNAANDGTTEAGQLVLTYDLYSVNPNASNFDPTTDLISAGDFLTATTSVDVAPTAAPESSPGLMLATASLVLLLSRKFGRVLRANKNVSICP